MASVPIAEGVFTWPSDDPQLIGSRCADCSATTFPRQSVCPRCSGTAMSDLLLPRRGTLVASSNRRCSGLFGLEVIRLGQFGFMAKGWLPDDAHRREAPCQLMAIDISLPGMKMETMNISLPKAMSEFVRLNVDRNYGNASEYFRDLVRERMQREIEADLKFLEATSQGAPVGPTEAEIETIVALQKRLRQERHARRA